MPTLDLLEEPGKLFVRRGITHREQVKPPQAQPGNINTISPWNFAFNKQALNSAVSSLTPGTAQRKELT